MSRDAKLVQEAVVQLTSDTLGLRRAVCWLATLLLLVPLQPMHAQTTGDHTKQMSDEQIGKRIAAADSYTVDAINRHDTYAVAAVSSGTRVSKLRRLASFQAALRLSGI